MVKVIFHIPESEIEEIRKITIVMQIIIFSFVIDRFLRSDELVSAMEISRFGA